MSRVVDVAVRHPRVRVASAPVVAVVHALDRMRSYRCPRGALSIAFLGDRETSQVHADYLDDPSVTDVITFPGEDHPGEPFAGEICVNIDQARRAAKEHGAAVICVTHDPRLEAYADRIIHIEDGEILDDRRTTPGAARAPQPTFIEA